MLINNDQRLINRAELLKHLHEKMDRTTGEKQRGIAGVVGAIESGKFDILPEPTDAQLEKLISYHDGWKDSEAYANTKELDFASSDAIKATELPSKAEAVEGILTEEELKDISVRRILKPLGVNWEVVDEIINSHRNLLSANAELSFKNNKLTEELNSAKAMLVQSETRRITESGLLK